jgi:hypothetical protein
MQAHTENITVQPCCMYAPAAHLSDIVIRAIRTHTGKRSQWADDGVDT